MDSSLVLKGLAYGDGSQTVESIQEAAERGDMQVWEAENSVLVTQVVETPTRRQVQCIVGAGNLKEIAELYPIVIEWAKAQGCTAAQFLGRPGWERTFLTREQGWRPVSVLYQQDTL